MTRPRHKARATALQALYEIDSVGRDPSAVIDRLTAETALTEDNAAFARELVTGVTTRLRDLDGQIRTYAPAWPVEQIAVIDRNILRLAIFEILFDNKVPVNVAVSEAVELARSFGSDTSGKFVNGVLGSVSAHAGRED
jgi:N utilization substance protein B